MPAAPELSPFDEVNVFLHKAAERLKLGDGFVELLRRPWRELQVSVPVRMDDGEIKVFAGYRVQHNGARGPYKGGIRYHPRADQDEVRSAGVADDMEDRARGHPLRRGQGRRAVRPAHHERGGAEPPHPSLHRQHLARPGRQPGHTRAGPGDRFADDGVDHGRVQPHPRLHAGHRDGQARRVRRVGWTRLGDRSRGRLRDDRGGARLRDGRGQRARGGAGVRRGGQVGRPPAERHGLHRGCGQRLQGRRIL